VEIRVESWNELTDRLFEQSYREDIHRFRSSYVFRGTSRSEYAIETSLMRLGGDYARMEHHLLRNFRKYASRSDVPHDSLWNWLAVAQHHGLPTRMLDWSFSPFVALHFATGPLDRMDRDGAVWMVDFVQTHRLVPRLLRRLLDEEGSDVFTAEMLDLASSSLASFDGLGDEPFLVFMEPPSLDERIVNQYALFSMMSSSRARLDEWLRRHPTLWRKLVIPAELKWEVRDKLDQANVSERVLFPGLDGLSAWLKRFYTPVARSVERPPDPQPQRALDSARTEG
jgi:hypothetical protein